MKKTEELKKLIETNSKEIAHNRMVTSFIKDDWRRDLQNIKDKMTALENTINTIWTLPPLKPYRGKN